MRKTKVTISKIKKPTQRNSALSEKVFIKTIESLRTKFATKDDLAGFATKDDLKQVVADVSDQIYDKLEDIKIVQDKLLKKFETWEVENTVGTEQIRELRVETDDHEKRISTLEASKN